MNHIESNINAKESIWIGADEYKLVLVYDTSEESRRNRRERVTLKQEFEMIHQVHSESKRLKIGDFCWVLKDVNSNTEWLYPIIIERKRKDDLLASIRDKRYVLVL